MATAPIVQAHDLTKTYGDLHAVDRLTLRIDPGEIYALLGLNGAGKTTTIRMLLGMVRPTSGEVMVLGRQVRPGRHDDVVARRLPRGDSGRLPRSHGQREPAGSGQTAWPDRPARGRRRHRTARIADPHPSSGPDAVAGQHAATRPREGAHPPSGRTDPRRTRQRSRPRRRRRDPGSAPRSGGRTRRHRAAVQPHPDRGCPARHQDRHHPQRTADPRDHPHRTSQRSPVPGCVSRPETRASGRSVARGGFRRSDR